MINDVTDVLANHMLLPVTKTLPVEVSGQGFQQVDKLPDVVGTLFNNIIHDPTSV
jgi:hypothetical protein